MTQKAHKSNTQYGFNQRNTMKP